MNRNQPGMARAYENTMETGVKNQFTADDRHSRKLARFLKGARFRYKAAFEKIGFALDRNPERLRLSKRILPERDMIGRICCHRRVPTLIKSLSPGITPERST